MKALFVLVSLGLVLSGCEATYSHVEISAIGASALPSSASDSGLEVSVGDILTAQIVPYNTDGNPMIGDVISDDSSILVALRTEGGGFAFLGQAAGVTQVRLLADHVQVGTLEAVVTAQPR